MQDKELRYATIILFLICLAALGLSALHAEVRESEAKPAVGLELVG